MTKAEEVAYFQRILDFASHSLTPGTCVLDFGCGDGALVEAFIDAGFDACGCDVVLECETARLV